MWKEKVLEYENQMIEDLKGLLSIESIRDDSKATADAPVDQDREKLLITCTI